jgi:hypothetical protein
MKTITIGFSKPKNKIFPIFSWIIRAYLKTPYSHVYIKFQSDSLNRDIIYEAVGNGVRFVGTNEWKKHAEEVKSYELNIKECNYVSIMQYCIDHSGQKYGLAQNVGIFLADVFNWKNNPFRAGKNCSELIAEILQVEGYKFTKPLNLVTPKDIDEVLGGKKCLCTKKCC